MLTSAQVTAFFATRLGGSNWSAANESQKTAALLSAEEQIADRFNLSEGFETDPRYLRAASLLASYLLNPAPGITYSSIKVGPIEVKPNEVSNAMAEPDLRVMLGDLVAPAVNPYRWDFR